MVLTKSINNGGDDIPDQPMFNNILNRINSLETISDKRDEQIVNLKNEMTKYQMKPTYIPNNQRPTMTKVLNRLAIEQLKRDPTSFELIDFAIWNKL